MTDTLWPAFLLGCVIGAVIALIIGAAAIWIATIPGKGGDK